jgi:hypothetical protein
MSAVSAEAMPALRGMPLLKAKELFPEREGWTNHQAVDTGERG